MQNSAPEHSCIIHRSNTSPQSIFLTLLLPMKACQTRKLFSQLSSGCPLTLAVHCRPTASRLVTYLQKLLKSTDSATAPIGRHERTVSPPPAGPPSVSDTPRDYHQQPAAGAASSSSAQQQHSHQTDQQLRHRPAQSMPAMAFTTSNADLTQAGSLPVGHELRSSAGYGNELGVPGPSRRLTPLAQGLQAASLCSLPAASAGAAAPAPAPDAAPGLGSMPLLPLAQEGPGSLSPLLSLQASPMQSSVRASGSDMGLLDDTELRVGSVQAPPMAGWMDPGRDLRDSAWGPSSSLQPPSAPALPRLAVLLSCLQ